MWRSRNHVVATPEPRYRRADDRRTRRRQGGGPSQRAPLRHRRTARLHAPPRRSRLHLPATRKAGAIRDRDEVERIRSDRHPAGLDRRLDLPVAERPPPGDRPGRPRPKAVPLSPATGASGAGPRSSTGWSRSPRRCPGSGGGSNSDLRKARPAPREGARRGRPAARADADPGRQRRVRPAQPLVRADDAARPARDASRARTSGSGSAASAGGPARGRPARPAAGVDRAALPGAARPGAVPVRRRRRRGPRRRLGRRQRLPARGVRAATSRRRTSGRGPGRCWRTGRCGRSSPSTTAAARAQRRRGDPRRRPTRLGNTPAVARGSYVHPAVAEAYLDGQLGKRPRRAATSRRAQ